MITRRNFLKGLGATLGAVPLASLPELPEQQPKEPPKELDVRKFAGLARIRCHRSDMEFRIWSGYGNVEMDEWTHRGQWVRGFGNDVTPDGCTWVVPVRMGDQIKVLSRVAEGGGWGHFCNRFVVDREMPEYFIGTDGPYPRRRVNG